MTNFENVSAMLGSLQPREPVYCVYPHVYRKTAQEFLAGFPGRVLYAVKANNDPTVLQVLVAAGIEHFDCASLVEIEQVRDISHDAVCYFMNPVRLIGAARSAQEQHGVKHFVVDHVDGLATLVKEIDASRAVIFARMAVHHKSARWDLSTKFGAQPDDMPQLLQLIADHGAEPALAFNVGSVVMSPDAYVHAIEVTTRVLEKLPFQIRLVDIGGGYPKTYPGFAAPPIKDYFAAIRRAAQLLLKDGGELLAEPGRALSSPGLSAVTQVLLRKDDRLYLNDGMYVAFWELRFDVQDRFPVRAFRGHTAMTGDAQSFHLYGPTCDSGDAMPGKVMLPANIDVGDYIEFGLIGAYSLSGRTDFNGFYSDSVVTIDSASALPPA